MSSLHVDSLMPAVAEREIELSSCSRFLNMEICLELLLIIFLAGYI